MKRIILLCLALLAVTKSFAQLADASFAVSKERLVELLKIVDKEAKEHPFKIDSGLKLQTILIQTSDAFLRKTTDVINDQSATAAQKYDAVLTLVMLGEYTNWVCNLEDDLYKPSSSERERLAVIVSTLPKMKAVLLRIHSNSPLQLSWKNLRTACEEIKLFVPPEDRF